MVVMTIVFLITGCKVETTARNFLRDDKGLSTPQTHLLHAFKIPIDSSERKIDSENVQIHFIVDDSESLEEIMNQKVKPALSNLAKTITQVKNTRISFYKLSEIDSNSKTETSVDGDVTTKLTTYYTPLPTSEITLSNSMSEKEIKDQIVAAINAISFKEYFSEENGLCFLARMFNTSLERDSKDKSQMVVMITNENDARYTVKGRSLPECLHQRKLTEKKTGNWVTDPAQMTLNYSDLRVSGYYLENNEKISFAKNFLIREDYPFNGKLFQNLKKSYAKCSKAVTDYIHDNFSIEVQKCTVSQSIGGKNLAENSITKDLFTEIRNYSGTNLCELESILQYFEENVDTDRKYLNNCVFREEAPRELVLRNLTSVNYNSVLGSKDVPEGIAKLVDSFEKKAKEKTSLVTIYYDENANDCKPGEDDFTSHGLAYSEMYNEFQKLDLLSYRGDVCNNDYNKLIDESIGREIEKSISIKYEIAKWPEDGIINTLKVQIQSPDQKLNLESHQFEIEFHGNKAILKLKQSEIKDLDKFEIIYVGIESQLN